MRNMQQPSKKHFGHIAQVVILLHRWPHCSIQQAKKHSCCGAEVRGLLGRRPPSRRLQIQGLQARRDMRRVDFWRFFFCRHTDEVLGGASMVADPSCTTWLAACRCALRCAASRSCSACALSCSSMTRCSSCMSTASRSISSPTQECSKVVQITACPAGP